MNLSKFFQGQVYKFITKFLIKCNTTWLGVG